MKKTLIALSLAAATAFGTAGVAIAAEAPAAQDRKELRQGHPDKHEGHGKHHFKGEKGERGHRGDFGKGPHFGKDGKKPETFTETKTRTYPDGRKFTSQVEQKVSDQKIERKATLTNTDGKKATHQLVKEFDKDGKVLVKTEKRSNFDGKTFERTDKTVKTDTGFERKSTWTGPDGKPQSRTVIVEGSPKGR